MHSNICPYPGLRPFNEEESIFFKGREQQVERLVKRLEEKKFLMVNGASGDGKSSLIYAGVIPYAKAGFFKAKYNNWIVADFRPERSPLKNLTAAICKQLKIEETGKTEKELGYGFSALCDMYKASSFYIDESKETWLNADEKERKVIKRKGANLLVLVDQFEEFFTNPENYQNGIPSIESQKTVNLLLETYKLAAAQDLPIYVVCTMRSDYIGQCAAFRGLPEAIGYSQFFVPRLKRQEIEQVIEGPAELAGCRISKRLTQTLLNSLTDGFDQLPILQHALNHIWKAANNGTDELDLIHLAMVGGISAKFLSNDDRVKFEDWCKTLPDYKLQLLEKPSLSNVLNAHANELYLTAHLHYKNITGKAIPVEQAQKIIKVVFQCLTKVDASRAVRNRMTLQEITNIINDEKVSITKVDQLLQIYREQGNTFLQPFIGELGENKELSPNAVLDITHESLIRNWTQLTEWANEEFDNLQNYLDFKKQLQRWINANKNSGYLLPIGPLSFFENWFEKLNPSKYWINRYEDFEGDLAQQLQQAEERLLQAQNFIQKSARRLIFSRTILRYGAQRIAITAGIMLLIGLCTYYYFDYKKKQNDYVLTEIVQDGKELFFSPDVDANVKADFLINIDRINEMRKQPYEFDHMLMSLNDDSAAFDIAYIMFNKCVTIADNDSLPYNRSGELSMALYKYLYGRVNAEINTYLIAVSNDTLKSKTNLSRINQFLGANALMVKDSNGKFKPEVKRIVSNSIFHIKELLLKGLKSKTQVNFEAHQFSHCINLLITIDDNPDYSKFIELISPLENNNEANVRFAKLFDKKFRVYLSCNSLPASGGFETVAQLYATQFDNSDAMKRKIISLVDSNYTFDLDSKYEPKLIYSALIRHAKIPIENFDFILDQFKRSKETHSKIKIDLIGKFIRELFPVLRKSKVIWLDEVDQQHSLLNYFVPENIREDYWDYYYKQLSVNGASTDSIKMNLAMFFKKRGVYASQILHDSKKSDMYFKNAIAYYKDIDSSYRHKNKYFTDGKFDEAQIGNCVNFLYPFIVNDFWDLDRSCLWNNFNFYGSGTIKNRYNDYLVNSNLSPFFNYLKKTNNLSLYDGKAEIKALTRYLGFGEDSLTIGLMNVYQRYSVNYLNKIGFDNALVDKVPFEIYLMLQQTKDTAKGINMIETYLKNFPKEFDIKQFDNTWLTACIELLAEQGCGKKLIDIIDKCCSDRRKRRICLNICNNLQNGPGIENTFVFLNGALKGAKKGSDLGLGLYRLLGKIGGNDVYESAQKRIRKSSESKRPGAISNFVLGVAETGNYYKAKSYISEDVSETNELNLLNQILEVEILRLGKTEENAHLGKWNDSQFFKMDITTRNFNIIKK
jgi:hypothetical protein